MPTANPRINVVLDHDLFRAVKKQARAQGISLSLKVRDLVAEALNLREDKIWLLKAEQRLASLDPKKTLSHEEIWKRA